jgi:signal transduction histidine kinase/DNA-binding response OmpR family regulator
MENTISINTLSDILTCAALFMLAAYHLMIYWGRKKDREEIYNLYFSMFTLSATAFIVAPYFQPHLFLFSAKPEWLTVPNMESFAVWCLFFSGSKFLNVLLKVPQKITRYFLFTYVTIAISFLLTLTGNLISLDFYFRNFLPYVLGIVAVNVFLIYILYGQWVYRQKLLRVNFYRILYLGFVALTLNIFIYRTIELLTMPSVLILGHYITAIILYIFAYALSVKFNTEFFELKALKVSLEKKVEERTHALQKSNQLLEHQNLEIENQKQEIIKANTQLSLRAEELFELNQTRSRFFTGISHEFRTPLTLIIGPLESFLSRPSDDKTKGEYELMLRQAQRLLAFINQLLELSKLEKGVQKLEYANDNFNRFVRTIVSSYSSLAHDLKVQLNFIDECSGELNAFFDKDKIEKIITNLITNALKFTEAGGDVNVTLGFNDDTQLVQLTIRDNGIGIEPEHLDHIFEPFYQIDSSRNHRIEGTGIGLSLVKELVELHHGIINVSSQVRQGTEFVIRVPLDHPSYTDVLIENDEISEIDSHLFESTNVSKQNYDKGKKNILLVEDNADMRTFIKANLPQEYSALEASNGQEGIEMAIALMPDLIITDIMMPLMNGVTMTRLIKQDERISHIPVIMLTAKVSMENKIEGLGTQADDYITKPFNSKELVLRIQNILSARQRLREKFTKCVTVNPTDLVTTSTDEKFLQNALLLIERNMGEAEFTSAQFCEGMFMSRAHVHRKLKALTGQSAAHFVRTIRLKRAAQLLKHNSASVSEIAYQTGFNNLSYFTRCFKEQYGMLPSNYNTLGNM